MSEEEQQSTKDVVKQVAEKPGSDKKVCRFYLRKGGCHFGDRCRFVHEGEVPQHPPKQQRRNKNRSDKGAKTQRPKDDQVSQQNGVETAHKETASEPEELSAKEDDTADGSEVKENGEKMINLGEENVCQGKDLPAERKVDANTVAVEQPSSSTEPREQVENASGTPTRVENRKSSKKQPRMCRYFMRNSCRNGDACPFSHDEEIRAKKREENRQRRRKDKENQSPDEKPQESETPSETSKEETERKTDSPKVEDKNTARVQTFMRRSLAKKLHDMSEEDISQLRSTEIEQLKKKFKPENRLRIVHEEEQESVYCVTIMPTDPDWTYEIQQFDLEITFPKDYPRQLFHVHLSQEQDLPREFMRIMNLSLSSWLKQQDGLRQKKETVELLFRPFLRWLDRNLDPLFTHALKQMKRDIEAKAAGIEIVPFEKLPGSQEPPPPSTTEKVVPSQHGMGPAKDEDTDNPKYRKEYHLVSSRDQVVKDKMSSEQSDVQPTSAEAEHDGEGMEAAGEDSQNKNGEAERKGTEIKLRGLKMTENVATLRAVSLFVTVACGRCKNKEDARVSEKNPVGIKCSRCSTLLKIQYRAGLIHQLSSTLGFLDLDSCAAFDLILVESSLMIGCLNCSKECLLQGLHYGGARDLWCIHCHQKMVITVESTRFQQLQPAGVPKGKAGMVMLTSKKARNVRDPAIREGYPLPDDGSCKHYKKSHRWLRFPCCGKAYPCDICHDSQEDHEAEFANRMICGYCSKEQPYTQKPCVSCSSSTTKAGSSHWEGGKGCRDRVKMSRLDNQKYRNVNKTASRKVSEPAKKKK